MPRLASERSVALGVAEPVITVGFAERFPPALLAEYFELRNWWYGRRLGVRGDPAPRDAFDDTSTIVLATDGRHCVGGVRATVCDPEAPRRLPMEELCPGLRLATLFPDLPLAAVAHAEFSKLVVARRDGAMSFRNTVAERIFGFLWGPDNPRPDVRYAFSLAATSSSRIYRALADAHGLRWEARPAPLEFVPPELDPVGHFSVQAYVLGPATRS